MMLFYYIPGKEQMTPFLTLYYASAVYKVVQNSYIMMERIDVI